MSHPRRRAPLACNFCRHRKRKCDGQRPCRLCRSNGVSCQFEDFPGVAAPNPSTGDSNHATLAPTVPGARRESTTSPAELLQRVEDLEAIVRHQSEQQPVTTEPTMQSSSQMAFPNFFGSLDEDAGLPAFLTSTFSPLDMSMLQATSAMVPAYGAAHTDDLTTDEDPLVIPFRHLTPTANLFSVPSIKKLIGEYPDDYFFEIESRRQFTLSTSASVGDLLASLKGSQTQTDRALQDFWTQIHPHFPVLDQGRFGPLLKGIAENGAQDEAEGALCLIVVALGNLMGKSNSATACQALPDEPDYFFTTAYNTLIRIAMTSFDFNLPLACGLVYTAIYLCYVQRPLVAWNLTHTASTKLQILVSRLKTDNISQEEADHVGRLCWTCFLLECDSLAEFHLPRSGIDRIIDNMPFSCLSNHTDRDGLLFIAICSIRRLLNRIHRSIYGTTPFSLGAMWSSTPPDGGGLTEISLGSVCSDLANQLDNWFASLPEAIKPDISSDHPYDLQDAWLRSRYWSARHIIYRPCLIYAVLADQHTHLPAHVLQSSEACVTSCYKYIEAASYILAHMTQFNWMTIQGLFACALVLSIAADSPLLCHLVPDLAALISKVETMMHRWAVPGSSAESTIWILKTIQQKLRFRRPSKRAVLSVHSLPEERTMQG